MGVLDNRKGYTEQQTQTLKNLLAAAHEAFGDRACVYATGSFGRFEAGTYSDLDLCIVSQVDKERKSLLSPLDEICLKADLISAIRKVNLPEIDGDGRYLGQFTTSGLINSIGSPEDDVTNTFTSRMLLLLESKPLIGENVHKDAIEKIVHAYWLDYQNHKEDFVPAYLANDILRLWRTFCVNYEARTRDLPPEKIAKRKTKNYKLKHSRILTCYSAILYLLAVFRSGGTVDPGSAVQMSYMTPIERIRKLLDLPDCSPAHLSLQKLIDQYERFLEITDASEDDLLERMLENRGEDFAKEASEFGQTMFEAIGAVGQNSRFHRLVVV